MFDDHTGDRLRRSPFHRTRTRALGLALALALVGSLGADPLRAAVVAGTATAQGVSLERALAATLRPAGPNAAEAFLRSLPEPRTVSERSVPNPQRPGRQDRLRTLRFQGIAITVYRVSASGKQFPVAVEVTGERFRARNGLRVGLTARQVRATLGVPDRSTARVWRYRHLAPSQGAPFELQVRFRAGRVSALRWVAYLD